ncbi:MAG: helix-turn-helix domain-containing protein [Ruminococcus sp.]|nr:helix-turn-helix domain-containing protein [Ruminococcus sp.]
MSISFSRLKMFRKQSGYTQEEIAEKLGVSRQAVAKWEKGDTLPDIESCIKLADLYGIAVDMLVRNMSEEEHTGDGRHVFGITRLNSKGQLTLPAKCREIFNLKPGDNILVLGDEEKGMALVNMGSLSGSISRMRDKHKEKED